ncbi:MAG: 6-carboxytetrahydropterin synthase, partial [Ktedonobacteraceae bacterium]
AVIERLDHHDLNEVTGIRTTAENLAHWIWDALLVAGLSEVLLYRICLWETAQGRVEITAAERA